MKKKKTEYSRHNTEETPYHEYTKLARRLSGRLARRLSGRLARRHFGGVRRHERRGGCFRGYGFDFQL
jgi:hypothetical protein